MNTTAIDNIWVVLSALLVFLMHGGFLALEAGVTRTKNSVNVALKKLSIFAVSIIPFWLIGYGLMFGSSIGGLIGIPSAPLEAANGNELPFFLFQAMFCATAVTIVSGAVAERMRYMAFLAAGLLMTLFIYPVIGHWVWEGGSGTRGWLADMGFVDFAGSTVVHSVAGWVALAAVILVGPRHGRFPENEEPRRFSGTNVPMSMLGVVLLWLGWFGFNGGSTFAFDEHVPRVLANTFLGGVGGVAGAMLWQMALGRIQSVHHTMNGTLGGLVAVTAGSFALDLWAALLVGAIAAPIVAWGEYLLERWRIDDAVGAVPVHLAAGIWGTLAVGLLGETQYLNTGLSRLEQVFIQAVGISAAAAYAFGVAYALFWIINRFVPLRVPVWAEEIGLNVAEHSFHNDLHELFDVMQLQAKTHDFTLRAPQEPFTEAGQIGMFYNGVIFELERASSELDMQAQRSDNLLRNVLPTAIADRLKAGEQTIAQGHEEVAVLFSDIVGFTGLTRQLSPSALVQLLDIVFSSFDLLAEKNKLEKIKTVGDAYMVVSGLPDPRPDFTRAVANMGLAMVGFCEEFTAASGISVRLRVGIHVGPVVGGVIGRRRFIFDVWGDSVNIASRMESSSEPGRVQVSEAAMKKITAEHYIIEHRGQVDIKGMGLMQTYWLNDRRPLERRKAEALEIARLALTAERRATMDPELLRLLAPWLAGGAASEAKAANPGA